MGQAPENPFSLFSNLCNHYQIMPGNFQEPWVKSFFRFLLPVGEMICTVLWRSLYCYRFSNRKPIVLMCSTLRYNLKGGERKMFDWNLFLTIIIAILKAIISALPVA